MQAQRNHCHPEFKVKIAIEEIEGRETINQLAAHYSPYPNQTDLWKCNYC
jgi:hypothetical protein